jgi:N-acetylneuraminate synthase
MTKTVTIGDKTVGAGHPTYVIAEIGLNHNGDVGIAKQLIDIAAGAGCDAVKFQKRTPELCVPPEQWNLERETPWGRLKYIEYRRRVELGPEQFAAIDRHCRDRGITWFASCWDEPSVEFIARFDAPCYKVASACLTDHDLLRRKRATGRPIILSTGMSTMAEIEGAVEALGASDLLIAHATSTYPCPVGDLNLRMMETLRQRFPACPIGYSGHETGLAPTWAAVALGATFVERHITLDRAMWGSDQSASVEVGGFMRLVSQIRDVERALGDGIKRIYAGELPQLEKLRRVRTAVRAAS